MTSTGAVSHMSLALAEARAAAARGEVPVGAVIVSPTGQVVAVAGNRTCGLSDPTAHAEMNAIRGACTVVGSERLIGCDLYVTLEPCAMCAAAISFARVRRLYYGASDPKGGGVEHGARCSAIRRAIMCPKSTRELRKQRRERCSETSLSQNAKPDQPCRQPGPDHRSPPSCGEGRGGGSATGGELLSALKKDRVTSTKTESVSGPTPPLSPPGRGEGNRGCQHLGSAGLFLLVSFAGARQQAALSWLLRRHVSFEHQLGLRELRQGFHREDARELLLQPLLGWFGGCQKSDRIS